MTHRNRALLDIAHDAPCLLLPGQHECSGPSEPCHSDMIRHGRGEHHKSHDCFAVPGCHNAHLAFNRANLGKDGYHAAWTEAMERYILWQWVSGKVRLADITQRPKDTSMEAPMCKICEHRHYVRDPHIFEKNTNADKPVKRDGRRGRPAGRDGSVPPDAATNTSREGRRVLKAEAARPDATRTAATVKPDPLSPLPQARGIELTKADKVTPGKRKTAPKAKKRKGKKK